MEINQCNPLYKPIQSKKPHDHLVRCWESIWQNPTPIHDKSFGKIPKETPKSEETADPKKDEKPVEEKK